MPGPIDYIAASNGSGEAVRAIVTTDRLISATTLIVDSVLNWPNRFVATSGTLDPLTGLLDEGTITVFKGVLTGSIITIEEFAPGYPDIGNTVGQVVVLKPSTFWADTLKTKFTDIDNRFTTVLADEAVANTALQTQITTLATPIYAYGTLGGELSGNKTFVQTANNGITKTNATTYTIVTAGLYLFHAQQLMNSTGATNFFSQVNGTTVHHGWQSGQQQDLITTFLKNLSVGDTVKLYVDAGVATVWTGDHSTWYLYLVSRN